MKRFILLTRSSLFLCLLTIALTAFTGCNGGGSSSNNSSGTSNSSNAALEWAWMGGSNTATTSQTTNIPGIYGTKGVAAADNIPGVRLGSATWVDKKGDLWLFGGVGTDSTTSGGGYLNDLWKYDPTSNQWTWVGAPKR